MIELPKLKLPIVEISIDKNVRLFIKREDLIHQGISGNKYWKMFFNIQRYLEEDKKDKKIITFGGAFSNHISATSFIGQELGISTLGIIRGDELQNSWQDNATLSLAHKNGMVLRFVSREMYRDKETLMQQLREEFPESLVVPEGGTNENGVEGIRYMLTEETQDFDYLCSAVGSGGTISGISKFAQPHQKILGFKAVIDNSLEEKVLKYSGKKNFTLLDASDGGFGKIIDENVRFINQFFQDFGISLDPVYTGKMLRKIFELIEGNYFPENSKILAFHTGGLQGIIGANQMLRKKNKPMIKLEN